MVERNLKKKIVLASGSPRRRQLLDEIGAEHRIAPTIDIDESYPDTLPAEKVPEYLSMKKACAHRKAIEGDEILLTADTVVIVDGDILGKPRSRQEAIAMLHRLSGKSHTVVTGVTLMSQDSTDCFSSKTEVTFARLSDDEIEYYVDKYSPFDKAGAYGIQEWIGFIGISSINGCYYNVMGLPLHDVYQHLKNHNRS